jgi:hypothetical protein
MAASKGGQAVSDTPRTDAVDAKCNELELGDAIFYAIFHFGKLERELNAANERIKRLEAAGDEAICPFEYAARVRIWTEAKEAKP